MVPFKAMGGLQEEILLVLELFMSTGLYNRLAMSGIEVRGLSNFSFSWGLNHQAIENNKGTLVILIA